MKTYKLQGYTIENGKKHFLNKKPFTTTAKNKTEALKIIVDILTSNIVYIIHFGILKNTV